jgi:hypothetical protein
MSIRQPDSNVQGGSLALAFSKGERNCSRDSGTGTTAMILLGIPVVCKNQIGTADF